MDQRIFRVQRDGNGYNVLETLVYDDGRYKDEGIVAHFHFDRSLEINKRMAEEDAERRNKEEGARHGK